MKYQSLLPKGGLDSKKLHNFFGDESELRASFTHYIQCQNYVSESVKESAVQYLHKALEFSNTEKLTLSVAEDELQYQLDLQDNNIPFLAKESRFTFIDLFAGIGGIRLAFQQAGGECIFSSEWDKYSKQTYEANFGEYPYGDITKTSVNSKIPEKFDVLCAGFPCQAFSIAGKRGGFGDTRGTMFFEVAKIIEKHRPKAIFLENVKGLVSHDKGKTLSTILNVLRNDLGYIVPEPRIFNAKDYGVPQNRERIFIAGFRDETSARNFQYPEPLKAQRTLSEVIEDKEVSVKYYLSDQYLNTLIKHKQRHADKGNGFGYEILDPEGIANAVVCGGMGRERNLIIDDRLTNFKPVTNIKGGVNKKGVRKMTPREWARLQGFPDEFKIVVSDAQAYKQFGNSVAVPAVEAFAKSIVKQILL